MRKRPISDRFRSGDLRFVPLSRDLMFENGLEVGSGFGALTDQTLFPDVDAFFVRFIRDF